MSDTLTKNRFDINLADIYDPRFELTRVYHGMSYPGDPSFTLNWGFSFLSCVSVVRLNAIKEAFGDKVAFTPQSGLQEPLGILVTGSATPKGDYNNNSDLNRIRRAQVTLYNIVKGLERVQQNVLEDPTLSMHVSFVEAPDNKVHLLVVGDPLNALLAAVGNEKGMALEHRSAGLLVPAILDTYCTRPTVLPAGTHVDEKRGLYFL